MTNNNQFHKQGVHLWDTLIAVTLTSLREHHLWQQRKKTFVDNHILLRWKRTRKVTVGFTFSLPDSVITGNDQSCVSYFQPQRKQKQCWSKCHTNNVLSGFHFITETRNKINSTDPQCFLTLIVSNHSGKTHLIAQFLRQHLHILNMI